MFWYPRISIRRDLATNNGRLRLEPEDCKEADRCPPTGCTHWSTQGIINPLLSVPALCTGCVICLSPQTRHCAHQHTIIPHDGTNRKFLQLCLPLLDQPTMHLTKLLDVRFFPRQADRTFCLTVDLIGCARHSPARSYSRCSLSLSGL